MIGLHCSVATATCRDHPDGESQSMPLRYLCTPEVPRRVYIFNSNGWDNEPPPDGPWTSLVLPRPDPRSVGQAYAGAGSPQCGCYSDRKIMPGPYVDWETGDCFKLMKLVTDPKTLNYKHGESGNYKILRVVAGLGGKTVRNRKSDPPTGSDMREQLEKLHKHADAGSPLILVGHSQGNLFLNAAYDSVQSANPETSVKAIHIGPASPTLRGSYVLADIDLVINALRFQGVNSVPVANLEIPFSRDDASGHM
jgi:hypothetical protein